jgi:hypothetical protein
MATAVAAAASALWRDDMLLQFLIGGAASLCNIVIHALVMAAVVRVDQFANASNTSRPWSLLIGS